MSMHQSSTLTPPRQQPPDGPTASQRASIPPAQTADAADREDTALLVGLSLWTARQHERDLARTSAQAGDRSRHSYPAVLVETLSRHADAGDPACRLVLDWLQAKGLIAGNAELVSHGGTV